MWNYFQHVLASKSHQALIHFSPSSLWDLSNPWTNCGEDKMLKYWDPKQADVLFLAGLDWQAVSNRNLEIPTINLIQGVRHADEGNPLREYLRQRAIRICVSQEVCNAITATGIVNGPIVTIPNGIAVPLLDKMESTIDKNIEILISGLKNPLFAHKLAGKLQENGHPAVVELYKMPRNQYLEKMSKARIAILLPLEREGFFLPALEAMAMGCLVVCPDCIGNRSFCLDGVNGFRPDYNIDAVLASVLQAIALDKSRREAILKESRLTTEQHNLAKERSAFHKLLTNLEKIWTHCDS